MIGISAVIATINRKEELKRLFDSVIANAMENIELIVVDQNINNLIDDLIKEYQNYLSIVHLKRTEANQSKARNYGAQYAKYPIVCFPDDDCWYDNDTLNKVSTQFAENAKLDLLIINWKQNQRKCDKPIVLTKKEIYSYKAPISYGTIILFFRRDAFNIIGFFLENIGLGLYIGAGEDAEIVFRSAKFDLNILYHPKIYVNHKYTPDYQRAITSTRSRQRASGFIYYKYKLPLVVVLRGLASPLAKVFLSMDTKKIRSNYNTFLARMEGLLYGIKNL